LEECGEANNTFKVYNTSIVVKADGVQSADFFWTDGDVTPKSCISTLRVIQKSKPLPTRQ